MKQPQFNHCLLVWMFCSRRSNSLINRLHKRGLSLTYRNETNKEFEHILREKSESLIHQTNLQVLMTGVHKIVNGMAPSIMNLLLNFRANIIHNIRNFQETFTENRTTYPVTYQAPFLWNIKMLNPSRILSKQKTKKTWNCNFCPSRLRKNYIQNLGLFKKSTLANAGRLDNKNL